MRNGDMRFCEKSLFGLEDAVFRFETCRVADGSKEKTKEYCKDYELLTINFLKRIQHWTCLMDPANLPEATVTL